jgi:hypothetical protein
MNPRRVQDCFDILHRLSGLFGDIGANQLARLRIDSNFASNKDLSVDPYALAAGIVYGRQVGWTNNFLNHGSSSFEIAAFPDRRGRNGSPGWGPISRARSPIKTWRTRHKCSQPGR